MLYITHLWIDKRFLKNILYQAFFYVLSSFFAKVGFSVKNVLKTALFRPNWSKNIGTLRLDFKMYIALVAQKNRSPEVKNKKTVFKGKNFAVPFTFLLLFWIL
jgi:hypothetical protein